MHISEYDRRKARAEARWYFFFNEYAWENADLFPAFGLRGVLTRVALVVGPLIAVFWSVGHFQSHFFERHDGIMVSLVAIDMTLLCAVLIITRLRDSREEREVRKKALDAFYLAHPYDYILL
jgi:hypothetical protein